MKLTTAQRRAARSYMREQIEDYRDPKTGQANLTLLVEATVDEFELWEYQKAAEEDGLSELDTMASDIEDGLI